jgi:hypothetical protein
MTIFFCVNFTYRKILVITSIKKLNSCMVSSKSQCIEMIKLPLVLNQWLGDDNYFIKMNLIIV